MTSKGSAVAAGVVIVVIAFGLLANAYFTEVQSNSQEAQSYSSVSSRSLALSSSLSVTRSELGNRTQANAYLLSQLNRTQTAYNLVLGNYILSYNPGKYNQTFPIWRVHQTMSPDGYEEWDLLDTFINHVNITTTQPSQFYIFDLDSFVSFKAGYYSVPLVNQTGTSFSYNFEPSVGCAVYVLFILNLENSPNTIIPDVTATYTPSPVLTGTCAG